MFLKFYLQCVRIMRFCVFQLIHSNQHSQHPKKILKLTGDSRLKREINRVDKQKSLNKKKKKVVEKKKMIDTECEDNINTVTDKASKRINH